MKYFIPLILLLALVSCSENESLLTDPNQALDDSLSEETSSETGDDLPEPSENDDNMPVEVVNDEFPTITEEDDTNSVEDTPEPSAPEEEPEVVADEEQPETPTLPGLTVMAFDQGDIDQLSHSQDGSVLVLSGNQIYKSSDRESWQEVKPSRYNRTWQAIALHPTDSSVYFAGLTGLVFLTFNDSARWFVDTFWAQGGDLDFITLYVSQSNPDLVYSSWNGRVYVVNTASKTRTRLSFFNEKQILKFADHENYFLASDHRHKIYLSQNGGNRFELLDTPKWGQISSMTIAGSMAYVGTSKGLYQKDLAQDDAWDLVDLEVSSVHDIDANESSVIITSPEGVYYFIDNEWHQLSEDEFGWVFRDGDTIIVAD